MELRIRPGLHYINNKAASVFGPCLFSVNRRLFVREGGALSAITTQHVCRDRRRRSARQFPVFFLFPGRLQ